MLAEYENSPSWSKSPYPRKVTVLCSALTGAVGIHAGGVVARSVVTARTSSLARTASRSAPAQTSPSEDPHKTGQHRTKYCAYLVSSTRGRVVGDLCIFT